MNSELFKNSKSLLDNDRPNSIEIDIILELFTIIVKKDSDKCLCSSRLPEIDNVNSFYENEIVPGLTFPINFEGKVKLSDVIDQLKQIGYPLIGAMISIFMNNTDEFVLFGSDPFDPYLFLDDTHITNNLLKLRAICYLEEKLIISNEKARGPGIKLSRSNSALDKKLAKRTKERKIGYIIEKVNTWRKLYNGFYDESKKFTKYSLDEAAKIIGISKKSLDDYLLQLRLGRKFGFDFNANKSCKVGVLRSYVKKNRGVKHGD